MRREDVNYDFDTDELRLRITETEQQALAHAEQLAAAILDGPLGDVVRTAALAVTVSEQVKLARRLRHALTITVAG